MSDLIAVLNLHTGIASLLGAMFAGLIALTAAFLGFWSAARSRTEAAKQTVAQILASREAVSVQIEAARRHLVLQHEANDLARQDERDQARSRLASALAAEFAAMADTLKAFGVSGWLLKAANELEANGKTEIPTFRIHGEHFFVLKSNPDAIGLLPPKVAGGVVKTFYRSLTLLQFVKRADGKDATVVEGSEHIEGLRDLAESAKTVEGACREMAEWLTLVAAETSSSRDGSGS